MLSRKSVEMLWKFLILYCFELTKSNVLYFSTLAAKIASCLYFSVTSCAPSYTFAPAGVCHGASTRLCSAAAQCCSANSSAGCGLVAEAIVGMRSPSTSRGTWHRTCAFPVPPQARQVSGVCWWGFPQRCSPNTSLLSVLCKHHQHEGGEWGQGAGAGQGEHGVVHGCISVALLGGLCRITF